MWVRKVGIVAVLLAAVWVRFYALDGQSFWNDEGNSARLSERSVQLIIEGTASDVHPPLYYLMLCGWRELVGASEFGLRAVSAFAGVIVVALTMRVARMLDVVNSTFRRLNIEQSDGRTISLRKVLREPLWVILSGLFVAVNPAMGWYGQEARMYMVLPLWVVGGTALLVQRCYFEAKSSTLWIGYVLVMTAGLYTHYFFPVAFGIHGIIILLLNYKLWWKWGIAVLVSCLLYIPWIPFMLNGMGGNRGEAVGVGQFLVSAWEFLLFGFGDGVDWLSGLLILGVVVMGIGRHWRTGLILIAWIMLPIMALIFVGATDAEFNKFLLMCVPPLAILLGRGLVDLWEMTLGRFMARVLAILVCVMVVAYSVDALIQQWHDPALARDDYRGMAKRIATDAHPNAGIILNAPNQWEVFTYYHREDEGDAPVYPLPRSRDEAAVLAELEMIRETHDRLYVLYWGDEQQDPERWVEMWLDAQAFKAHEEWVGDVRFVQYAFAAGGEAVDVGVTFGDVMRLNRVTLGENVVRVGDVIQIAIEWEAVGGMDGRYKQFVHLVGEDGLAAQTDSEFVPMTTEWQEGDVYTENVGIIANGVAGGYTLFVGLYDVDDPMNRLKFVGNDSLEIGIVFIQD